MTSEASVANGSSIGQPLAFQQLRWRLLRNTVHATLRGSMLRLIVILLCSLVVWSGVFAGSIEGFTYLHKQHIPLAGGIVGTLFDLMFLTLAVLLIFSSGIILYSSLFSSAETSFLLSMPAAADQVFAYKFQGALAFSSWAFLLLGSPVLVAYGLVFGGPWYYYILLLCFFLGFVLLPGSLGALGCLLVVNYLPRRRRQVLVVTIALLITAVAFWLSRVTPSNWTELLNRDFVQRVVGQLSLAQGPLSPNHWLTRGIQAAARRDLVQAAYYLALVWSNGLFLYVLITWAARRLYRQGFNRVATGGSLRRRYGGLWMDQALTGMVGFLDPQTRLLIVKDFRMFRRDPAQWAQVLIFTGLMVLYFTNMRQFYQNEDMGQAYQNGVSLMNLGATALLLCAYTGRFIYPMLSLEGRKFWILGLLPLHRDRLLWGKFAFSATWSVLTAVFLVFFSDLMLGMPGWIIALHALAVVVLALGLSGLSVGLGAWMPNFRESDPSKIAVGFGGTLNLVTGLLYLLLVIALMAVPAHLHLAGAQLFRFALGAGQGRGLALGNPLTWWLVGGLTAGLALGTTAVVVPLRFGARALRRMEF
jgi:ABC-2 type transport system permease protein